MAFREQLNMGLEARGVKLSVNDFVIKACAMALQAVPDANAVWAGDRIFKLKPSDVAVAVAIYAAKLTGTPLSVWALAVGVLVAFLVSLSSVSLPGTLSFVVSVGPIAMAMGVPVGPLGLLVAVEMLPDLMRTLGNVTMDVAVTAAVDRGREA